MPPLQRGHQPEQGGDARDCVVPRTVPSGHGVIPYGFMLMSRTIPMMLQLAQPAPSVLPEASMLVAQHSRQLSVFARGFRQLAKARIRAWRMDCGLRWPAAP